jgi:hypothetical protein
MSNFREKNKGRAYEDIISELEARICHLEKRLLIVDPISAKYPALVEAYQQYKFIERITIGCDDETN